MNIEKLSQFNCESIEKIFFFDSLGSLFYRIKIRGTSYFHLNIPYLICFLLYFRRFDSQTVNNSKEKYKK